MADWIRWNAAKKSAVEKTRGAMVVAAKVLQSL